MKKGTVTPDDRAEAEIWKAIAAVWECRDGALASHDRYRLPGGEIAVLWYDIWDHRGRRCENMPRGAAARDLQTMIDLFPAAIVAEAARLEAQSGAPWGPGTHCLVWRMRPEIQRIGLLWYLYARFGFMPKNGCLIGPSSAPPVGAGEAFPMGAASEIADLGRSAVLPGGAWGGTEIFPGLKPTPEGDTDAG